MHKIDEALMRDFVLTLRRETGRVDNILTEAELRKNNDRNVVYYSYGKDPKSAISAISTNYEQGKRRMSRPDAEDIVNIIPSGYVHDWLFLEFTKNSQSKPSVMFGRNTNPSSRVRNPPRFKASYTVSGVEFVSVYGNRFEELFERIDNVSVDTHTLNELGLAAKDDYFKKLPGDNPSCPDCGFNLLLQEGCVKCTKCGFSEC